jgi:serine/threonine-protein kinase RsbW
MGPSAKPLARGMIPRRPAAAQRAAPASAVASAAPRDHLLDCPAMPQTEPPMTSPDVPKGEQTQVKISIGSRYDHIDLIQVVVDDALARLGLDDDARHWVGIAIREAVANAIKHGNRQDPDKAVDVELAVAGDQAVIRVYDQGQGFDLQEVADPLAPENRMKTSGRGIFYMKNFMDTVLYEHRPEGGTVVTMRKTINGDAKKG